jgi:hypothetical protein
MSAPIDTDTNSLTCYAPKRHLPERASQTSEGVAVRGSQNGLRRSFPIYEERTTQEQRSLARSLDPEFLPPPPSAPRWRWRLSVSLLTAMSVMGVAYFSASERLSPPSIVARPQASDGTANLGSSFESPATGLRTSTETENLRLQFGGWAGLAAEPSPVGMRLHGPADSLTTLFGAVVAGTSIWSELGADVWPISAPQDVLANAPYNPPDAVNGLSTNRWPTAMDWAAASQVIRNSGSVQQPSVVGPHEPAQSDREKTAVLVKQGRLFLANKDPAGARVVLERAARYKDAEAALMLAATYDPVALRELKAYGVAANIAKARTWYEKAKEFGSSEAPRRLEILASATQ